MAQGTHPVDSGSAIDFVLERVDGNLVAFDGRFPSASSEDDAYSPTDGMTGWTASFWTGMLWLAYEVTGEERYRTAAIRHLDTFERRLDEGVTAIHDLGFLYTLSAIATHRLTGDESARDVAIDAADELTVLYRDCLGVIEAGTVHPEKPDERIWEPGQFSVDAMMNLPLLYWASQVTGDSWYAIVADSHAERTRRHVVRDDGSTFHSFKLDIETAEPIGGETYQGYADDSCWARGQAWGLYGFTLAYQHTGREDFKRTATRLADHYVERLPPDGVPPWDLVLDVEAGAERDSSAAAIAACGLHELARRVRPGSRHESRYRNVARRTLGTLTSGYTTEGTDADGVLDGAVYNYPHDKGVGESSIWGDYFYFEGLVRQTRDWEPYWCGISG